MYTIPPTSPCWYKLTRWILDSSFLELRIWLTLAVPSLAATRWVVSSPTLSVTLAPRLLATRKGLLRSSRKWVGTTPLKTMLLPRRAFRFTLGITCEREDNKVRNCVKGVQFWHLTSYEISVSYLYLLALQFLHFGTFFDAVKTLTINCLACNVFTSAYFQCAVKTFTLLFATCL